MFIHCNVRRAKCIRFTDPGKAAEYYFTWRAYIDGGTEYRLAQGFSLGCPIEDGYAIATGEMLELNDPSFTLELPAAHEGETKRFMLDLFCWKADSSTAETKRLFTNAAAKKLMQIYEASEKRNRKTCDGLLNWVQNDDNEVLQTLADTGVQAAYVSLPYRTVASTAMKVFDFVLDFIKSNNDDYFGISRSQLIYTRQEGKPLFRWIFNSGFETWFPEETPVIYQSWRVREANRADELDCKLVVQIALNSPTEFK